MAPECICPLRLLRPVDVKRQRAAALHEGHVMEAAIVDARGRLEPGTVLAVPAACGDLAGMGARRLVQVADRIRIAAAARPLLDDVVVHGGGPDLRRSRLDPGRDGEVVVGVEVDRIGVGNDRVVVDPVELQRIAPDLPGRPPCSRCPPCRCTGRRPAPSPRCPPARCRPPPAAFRRAGPGPAPSRCRAGLSLPSPSGRGRRRAPRR